MVFLVIFLVGLVLTVLTFAIGEIFDFGEGDAGDIGGLGDVGIDGLAPSPFSSRVFFVFITAFGGFGFIGQSLDWNIWWSSLLAVFGGFAIAGGTFFLVILPLARQQGSTRVTQGEFLHLEGQAVSDIPADGVGRVSFIAPGSGARVQQAARSAGGVRIPFGTTVTVVAVGPNSLSVVPATQEMGEPAEPTAPERTPNG